MPGLVSGFDAVMISFLAPAQLPLQQLAAETSFPFPYARSE